MKQKYYELNKVYMTRSSEDCFAVIGENDTDIFQPQYFYRAA